MRGGSIIIWPATKVNQPPGVLLCLPDARTAGLTELDLAFGSMSGFGRRCRAKKQHNTHTFAIDTCTTLTRPYGRRPTDRTIDKTRTTPQCFGCSCYIMVAAGCIVIDGAGEKPPHVNLVGCILCIKQCAEKGFVLFVRRI